MNTFTQLDLRATALSGTLPSSWTPGVFAGLVALDLSFTRLSGTVPAGEGGRLRLGCYICGRGPPRQSVQSARAPHPAHPPLRQASFLSPSWCALCPVGASTSAAPCRRTCPPPAGRRCATAPPAPSSTPPSATAAPAPAARSLRLRPPLAPPAPRGASRPPAAPPAPCALRADRPMRAAKRASPARQATSSPLAAQLRAWPTRLATTPSPGEAPTCPAQQAHSCPSPGPPPALHARPAPPRSAPDLSSAPTVGQYLGISRRRLLPAMPVGLHRACWHRHAQRLPVPDWRLPHAIRRSSRPDWRRRSHTASCSTLTRRLLQLSALPARRAVRQPRVAAAAGAGGVLARASVPLELLRVRKQSSLPGGAGAAAVRGQPVRGQCFFDGLGEQLPRGAHWCAGR